MSRPLDRDLAMVLAQQVPHAAPTRRAVLLAEIEAMLANATPEPDLDGMRLEIRRLAEVAP